MTYGWAIFIVLIVLGILVYTGTIPFLNMCDVIPQISGNFNYFIINDHWVTGSDSEVLPNNFFLQISGKLDKPLTVRKLEIYKDEQLCGEASIQSWFTVNDKSFVIVGGELDESCTKPVGKCYRYELALTYTKEGGLEKVDKSELTGRFGEQEELYKISGWKRTDFSGEALRNANGNKLGSYGGVCPAVPPDTSGFVDASELETWHLPNGCNTGSSGGCTGCGFGSTYCSTNAQYLANGWFATNLYVDNIFSGHQIYLSGNAHYKDLNGIDKYDGICINDNFYFYVNSQVITRGGTTGVTNGDNKLDPGEEVLKNCDGCYDIDSSAWCIPSIELTGSSAFKFGEDNEIRVLVEDYCKGGGQEFAGGLKIFQIYFV